MTSYGLPRHVTNFLRQMEAYKELLKWEISESPNKITLVLSWNFRKHSSHESLWSKLQRTLKLNRSHDSAVPQNVSRFVGNSPRRSTRYGSISRSLSWARISSISLPSRWRHHHTSSSQTQPNSIRASASLQGSFHQETPQRRSLSLPVSPSRYSWPDAGNTSPPLTEPIHSTPIPCTPDSVRSSDLSPQSPVRITYRHDLDQSLENIIEKYKQRTKQELDCIRREWNQAIKSWPQVLLEEDPNTSSERTDSDPEVNLQNVNQTVQRCLETCDSILEKHSTLIL